MRVAFRVDSSSEIGGGHLMRCVTLAESLVDFSVEVFFICRDFPGNLIDVLKKNTIETYVLPQNNDSQILGEHESWLKVKTRHDADETIAILKDKKIDLLIIDHYGIDINWEMQLRPYVNRIMVIDDLANRRHECDILLDQNYLSGYIERYKELLPSSCISMLGPRYILLRKEFKKITTKNKISKDFNNVLVFFTSGKDKGHTKKSLEALMKLHKKLDVNVVVGHGNEDIHTIKDICKSQGWRFHCGIDYMALLMSQADLAIGSGGASTWERCYLGLPAIVVVLAENQDSVTQMLHKEGVLLNLGWYSDVEYSDYLHVLKTLTDDDLLLMSERALRLVDEGGVDRVISQIFKNSSKELN